MNLSFEYTGNPDIPAIVTKGDKSSPVWIQQNWNTGTYANYIKKNGCGHCCTAMALNLNGIKINPHEEYELCRKMWGEPRMGEPLFEDHFISETGICEIIRSFGVEAQAFGVEISKSHEAAKHIISELSLGKSVIIWSHPSDKLSDNPFSPGEHYVLAVGLTDEGKIFIANSSSRSKAENGIQHADFEMIEKVLFEGTQTTDYTWGRYDFTKSGAYVVVG